jgi:hypothetical protein
LGITAVDFAAVVVDTPVVYIAAVVVEDTPVEDTPVVVTVAIGNDGNLTGQSKPRLQVLLGERLWNLHVFLGSIALHAKHTLRTRAAVQR